MAAPGSGPAPPTPPLPSVSLCLPFLLPHPWAKLLLPPCPPGCLPARPLTLSASSAPSFLRSTTHCPQTPPPPHARATSPPRSRPSLSPPPLSPPCLAGLLHPCACANEQNKCGAVRSRDTGVWLANVADGTEQQEQGCQQGMRGDAMSRGGGGGIKNVVDRAQGRAAYGAAAATRCGNRLRRTGSRLCTTVIRMRCREQTLLMLLLLLLLSSSASEGGSTSIDGGCGGACGWLLAAARSGGRVTACGTPSGQAG